MNEDLKNNVVSVTPKMKSSANNMKILNSNQKPTFTVLKEINIEGKPCFVIQCDLFTGRTHQIRVHLSENNHPIVGDIKYGNKFSPIKRLGLHASKLVFVHPLTKKLMEFKINPPKVFNSIF